MAEYVIAQQIDIRPEAPVFVIATETQPLERPTLQENLEQLPETVRIEFFRQLRELEIGPQCHGNCPFCCCEDTPYPASSPIAAEYLRFHEIDTAIRELATIDHETGIYLPSFFLGSDVLEWKDRQLTYLDILKLIHDIYGPEALAYKYISTRVPEGTEYLVGDILRLCDGLLSSLRNKGYDYPAFKFAISLTNHNAVRIAGIVDSLLSEGIIGRDGITPSGSTALILRNRRLATKSDDGLSSVAPEIIGVMGGLLEPLDEPLIGGSTEILRFPNATLSLDQFDQEGRLAGRRIRKVKDDRFFKLTGIAGIAGSPVVGSAVLHDATICNIIEMSPLTRQRRHGVRTYPIRFTTPDGSIFYRVLRRSSLGNGLIPQVTVSIFDESGSLITYGPSGPFLKFIPEENILMKLYQIYVKSFAKKTDGIRHPSRHELDFIHSAIAEIQNPHRPMLADFYPTPKRKMLRLMSRILSEAIYPLDPDHTSPPLLTSTEQRNRIELESIVTSLSKP
ncbi:hypothetical protein JW710_02135 [Candidatus Dojkabacteria bacterium]|nr:hypothetical protein [Candidatus Dojkabacteria bacterium]